jgi:hypothetical protein
MDLLPTQIQFGIDEWTADEGFSPDHEAFRQFYVRDEAFYVRGFVPTDYWTPQWYPGGMEFYTGFFANIPTLWTTDPDFYPSENFYVRSFSGTDYFTDSFYTPEPAWYVRSFSPTGSLWNFYLQETSYD